MNIDHDRLLPKLLKAMYPDKEVRKNIENKLNAYGKYSFHAEVPSAV